MNNTFLVGAFLTSVSLLPAPVLAIETSTLERPPKAVEKPDSLLMAQNIRTLPRTFGASLKLLQLVSFYWPFVGSNDEMLAYIQDNGSWYIDTANGNNINIIAPRPSTPDQRLPDSLRATLDPTRSRVISAGVIRSEQVINGIKTGRFIPTRPQ